MGTDTSDLAQAIADWAHSRPLWEQQALRLLARDESIDHQQLEMLADTAYGQASGSAVDVATLVASDLAGGSSDQEAIRITAISDPQSVNAITWRDGISFHQDGITIIYGENGSGKSGYARILKKVTRSRHDADVLSNVFQEPTEQSAQLTVLRGNQNIELTWPSDRPDYLARVSFYDSDCSTRYISTDNEVAYRPSAIALLNDLVRIAREVRAILEARRPVPESPMVDLPLLLPDSKPDQLVRSLSADTSALEIDMACALPVDYEATLSMLQERISNMETDDAEKRSAKLQELRGSIEALFAHIHDSREILSDDVVASIRDARDTHSSAREAADVASSARFSSEPIGGIGSPAWSVLWNAAKRFSEEVAYPDLEFPVLQSESGPGRCVLCQQPLASEAAARLHAFHEYVAADAERAAREARVTLEELVATPQRHQVFDTSTELALERIKGESESAETEIRSELKALEDRRSQIISSLDHLGTEVDPLPTPTDFHVSNSLLDASGRQLADLTAEDLQEQLSELRKKEAEIRSRLAVREHRSTIEAHISHLRDVQLIEEAVRLTNTTGITRRSAELTRTHVSDVLKHHFSQETVELGLKRVRLADAGGEYGNLRHRAQLVGAVQRVPLETVLSEGEQTALGLAGFLTEVETDSTGSAVVLDDPLSSLDHVRREKMAARIAELAAHRQVVVFTHDVAFVVDLKRAAISASVGSG